jgi:uncharacterized protein (DUF427 family)
MTKIPEELQEEVNKWRNMKRKRPDNIATPGPGQESIWDYPRPPKVELFTKKIRVEFAGVVIADTTESYKVSETSSPPCYYIPQTDIKMDYLFKSAYRTLCEWKGSASYWTIQVGDKITKNAGWSYPEPWDGFEQIKDCIAFFAGRVDGCYIDTEKVVPQAGDFYGGWITSNIVGPFKGDPGTEAW